LTDREIPLDPKILEEKKKLSVVARNDEVAKERLKTEKKFQKPHYAPLEFEARYGKWFKDYFTNVDGKDISCHEGCLVFSPQLFVRPPDDDLALPLSAHDQTIGKMGFRREDVLKELTRARGITCFLCGEKGANIGCSMNSCRKSFHYPCAQMAGLVTVLDNDSNPAFCWTHSTKKYRYKFSSGQAKYALDVEWKKTESSGLKVDNECVTYKRTKTNSKRTVIQKHTERIYLKMVQDFIEKKNTIDKRIDDEFKSKYDEVFESMSELERLKIGYDKDNAKTDEYKKHCKEIDIDERYFTCGCCQSFFGDLKDIVVAKCCKFANFHRLCLTQLGITKGLCHFSCPLCQENRDQIFAKCCIAQGVMAPNKPPNFELDDDFDDQYEGNKRKVCDLYESEESGKENKCKLNQLEGFDGTEEEVINCDDCGSNGVHIACNELLLATYNEENRIRQSDPNHISRYDYYCDICRPFNQKKDAPETEEEPVQEDKPAPRRRSVLEEIEESSDDEAPLDKNTSVESVTKDIQTATARINLVQDGDTGSIVRKDKKRKASSTFENTPTKKKKSSISNFFAKK